MTVPSSAQVGRRRSSLWLVLGGCALLTLVLLCVCAGIGIWIYAPIASRTVQTPATSVSATDLEALPTGEASRGEQLFRGSAGCSACHSLEAGQRIVGPSLSGVATRAANRKPDTSAEQYLYESITQTNAYVVEGFQPDLMPKNFGLRLSSQDLADLIAFLMTQK